MEILKSAFHQALLQSNGVRNLFESDITMWYISANPYINSKVAVGGFNAKNHFHRIVDVWRTGWDGELGTVHPKK